MSAIRSSLQTQTKIWRLLNRPIIALRLLLLFLLFCSASFHLTRGALPLARKFPNHFSDNLSASYRVDPSAELRACQPRLFFHPPNPIDHRPLTDVPYITLRSYHISFLSCFVVGAAASMIYELALEQLSLYMFPPGIVTRLKQLSEDGKKHEGRALEGAQSPPPPQK